MYFLLIKNAEGRIWQGLEINSTLDKRISEVANVIPV
jgi:hypothetical protein